MTLTAGKIHAILVISLALSACASTPPPRTELDAARQALQAASAARGLDAFATAEARLRQAEAAFAERDYRLAAQLADEARLAALVAEARQRAGERRREVESLTAENAGLRAELLEGGARR